MTVAELIKHLQETPNMGAEVRLATGNLKTAVGDFTGGASEDLFTLADHGLSDGDRVQLLYESAAGVVTGSVGDVFVIADKTTNTFRLDTEAGVLVENTADGTAIFEVLSDMAVSMAGAGNVTFPADAPEAASHLTAPDEGYVTIG